MTLRLVETPDVAALAAIHAEGFDPSWTEAEIADVLSWPGVFGLMAGDPAAGMILARVVAEDAEVLTLAVTRAARRAGLGRVLMSEACRFAAASGADAMFLEVAVDNRAAIALYEGMGFVKAGRRKDYYDRGPAGWMDALALRLDLGRQSA
ncbi:GNAT family N-acetyltransferase [Phenylobacterium sp.]|uniref:GNAT family N-acetyltransferase n=1 Tax=Phenylobacterium sp. TaxID=1871053 RepID=UPI0035B2CC96